MGHSAQAHNATGAGIGTLEIDPALGSSHAHAAGGGNGSAADDPTVTSSPVGAADPDGDWLVLSPVTDPTSTESGISSPWQPAKTAGGGAALPPRGGSGNGAQASTTGLVRGRVTPFRVPAHPSAGAAAGGGAAGSAALLAAVASAESQGLPSAPEGRAGGVSPLSFGATTMGQPAAAPGSSGSSGGSSSVATPTHSALVASGGSTVTSSGGTGVSGGFQPVVSSPSSGMPSFPYFNAYVLDQFDGVTLFPGVTQVAHVATTVVLDAQVTGASVSSYDWNTTGLTGASSTSGASTSQLTIVWESSNSANALNTVTLSVTDTNNHVETFTYDFELLSSGSSGGGGSGGSGGGGSGGSGGGGSGGGSGGGAIIWPTSDSPDTVGLNSTEWSSHGVSVNAMSGALDAVIPLPSYNPNVPALGLTYNSQAADPQPIILAENTLSSSSAVPSQVNATLTFNGTAGTTEYYNTSSFNPGDVQQVALQANAGSLSTGRYGYSMQVVDGYSTPTTTTYTGTATVLNESTGALGAGWSVAGLQQITSAGGGAILSEGVGGATLWFTASGGSGSYTSPAGDFSTLSQLSSGGGWTRLMTDGTEYTFNSSGYETASIDRNGLHTTYSYNGSNQLSGVEDPYGKLTTFTYSGGHLESIDDPAGRLTTFTYSGGNLTAVEQADDSRTTYTYGSSGQMTGITDPLGHVVSIVYDSAGRVGTISLPESASEQFSAFQEQGWTDSGTISSPTPATLFASAASSFTNPNGNTTSVLPDWYGLGTAGVTVDALGDIATNDVNANGLVVNNIDPLNRISQFGYDTHGNMTSHVFPDYTTETYTYNSYAEPLTYTNANNATSDFTYDSNGNLTVIKDPLGNLTTMTYTGTGQVQTVEDANLNTTTYQYDSQDRLTTTTYPNGTTAELSYNSQGDVTASTDPRGNTTTDRYDALNRLTGTTDPLGGVTTYVYDSGGNLVADEAPTPTGQTARTTNYAYDSMNRVTTITDPLGNTTVYAYDADGNVTKVTDPMSRVTTITYDALDRPIVVKDPTGGVTTTTYDADGETIQVVDPMGRVTTTTYNVRGWVATQTNPLGYSTTYTYDNIGHVTEIGQPASSGGGGTSGGSSELIYYDYNADGQKTNYVDPSGASTSYIYDAVGNLTRIIDPNGNTTTYSYDSMNRLTTITDPLGHTTAYGYNADGQQTTVTDALGHTTTTLYDANGRATTMVSAIGGVTTITYDLAGRETSLTDPVGNTTSWSYNAADRVTQVTDPNGATVTYLYNADGQVTDTTDQDGRRTTYAYDANGDNTGQSWLSGGTSLDAITYTYNADGELTGAADHNATLTMTYDSGGHLTSEATSGPGTGQPSVTLSYVNDPSGNPLQVSDNLTSQGIITSSYDPNERVIGIQSSYGGAAGPQVAVTYDSGGRITSQSRTIGGAGTSVNTSYSYDAANRQTTITDQAVTSGSGGTTITPIGTYVYSYDQANRVTTMVDAEGTYTYTYDNSNELTAVNRNGSQVESYSYDNNGNRTGTGYSTGVDNEQTASPGYTYTYDKAGNLISQTNTSTHVVTTYTYDFRNRLTEVTTGGTVVATYTYDALDRRIGIDDNGAQTWTVYDGTSPDALPYADFNGSGALAVRYVSGPGVVDGAAVDELLARTSAGGATAWYLTDKLGSVRDVVDSSGTVLDHVVYDSFGNVLSESSPSNGDRFKFAGMEYDAVTGQYYDRARGFDPASGRFIVQDPMGFSAGSANLYDYVGNSSTNRIDPSGLQESGGGNNDQQSETLRAYYKYKNSAILQYFARQTAVAQMRQEVVCAAIRLYQAAQNANLVRQARWGTIAAQEQWIAERNQAVKDAIDLEMQADRSMRWLADVYEKAVDDALAAAKAAQQAGWAIARAIWDSEQKANVTLGKQFNEMMNAQEEERRAAAARYAKEILRDKNAQAEQYLKKEEKAYRKNHP